MDTPIDIDGKFTPTHGDTYYAIFKDADGVYKVRRHYWDGHPFDDMQLKADNCYYSLSMAQVAANNLNRK